MAATYIIFKKVPFRSLPVWVETVEGLERGEKRLLHYTSRSKDEFYLFDVSQARVLDALKVRSHSA
ncbi:MAG TPA: hypothetical protein VNE63_23950 [Candidatus Acidoferrales bacterium]|nr:hypothetical protein [Candidatus Acidoferrales bacterium]